MSITYTPHFGYGITIQDMLKAYPDTQLLDHLQIEYNKDDIDDFDSPRDFVIDSLYPDDITSIDEQERLLCHGYDEGMEYKIIMVDGKIYDFLKNRDSLNKYLDESYKILKKIFPKCEPELCLELNRF